MATPRDPKGRGEAAPAEYLAEGLLQSFNLIDGQSPETTAETNPVWWQVEVGSLQRGFAGLFEMP